MNEQEVLKRAWAMPITNPAYPRPPIRFIDRELLIIAYRTDIEALQKNGMRRILSKRARTQVWSCP